VGEGGEGQGEGKKGRNREEGREGREGTPVCIFFVVLHRCTEHITTDSGFVLMEANIQSIYFRNSQVKKLGQFAHDRQKHDVY